MKIPIILMSLFIWAFPAWAQEANRPVPVPPAETETTTSKAGTIKEVTAGITTLDYEQTYQSPYLDVRSYRYVAFYVLEQKVLNSPLQSTQYRLNAFFSVNTDLSGVQGMQANEMDYVYKGWQEFGSGRILTEHSTGDSNFITTTTGVTSSRVLYMPVYGPYVRVELKNLTEDKSPKRVFRIYAYLVPA